MKSVKFLIVAALMVMTVNSARSEFETTVKEGEKVKYSDPTEVMSEGVIKSVSEARGFGFIEQGNGNVLFFLIKDFLKDNPKYKGKVSDLEGSRVSYDVCKDKKETRPVI